MIKAVIFDMDGVLVDAREWHFLALNRALRLFGVEITPAEHEGRFDGMTTMTKLEILSQERNLPRELHRFINDLKQDYTTQLIWAHCSPVFNIQYCLTKLKADGILLGVASNSIRETVSLMMQKSDIEHLLEVKLGNQDAARPKPAPDIYVEAFRRLNVLPHEVLVVEDNMHGIQAARSSQAHVMTVSSPSEVRYSSVREAIKIAEGMVL
jgi:beta-phosphoglucomutase